MRSLAASLASLLLVVAAVAASPKGAPPAPPAPSAGGAPQQKFDYIGPGKCINCHDHAAEKLWYETKELPAVQKLFPEKGANAGHINSLAQLDTPKSDVFAKAIDLKDKYDVKGECIQCHGTVFGGDANAGVSCESCHGPASGYLSPHQNKGQYEAAVSQFGMIKLIGNLRGWVQQCTNCHVMNDDRLIKAGHPSGDNFDVSKKYEPVSLHFRKAYKAAEVEEVAKPAFEAILKLRRQLAEPPPATPEPTPTATATPTTTATPTATATATPTPKPRPRVVRPRIDPTSIDPPAAVAETPAAVAPPPAATTAPAPTTAPSDAPAAATSPDLLHNPIVWAGVGVVLIGLIAMLFRKKK